MSILHRVTLTLPSDLLDQVRAASGSNLSQFVAQILRQHLESEHRKRLREELIAGYVANAEEALAIAEEFRYADHDSFAAHVPPSPELEPSDASELSTPR